MAQGPYIMTKKQKVVDKPNNTALYAKNIEGGSHSSDCVAKPKAPVPAKNTETSKACAIL